MRFIHIQQNKILTILTLLCVVGLSLFSAPRTSAAPNYEINYQGKLTNASNVAVADGTYNMRFWLLTSPSVATTSAIWSEELTGTDKVQVTNGLFSVMLGSTSPLTGVDFNQTLYLGVEIGGTSTLAWDGEMSPRKILGAVPAAFHASTSQNAVTVGGVASTSFIRSDEADTASGLLTFTGGIISNSSSTITNLTTLIATTTTLVVNGEQFTDLTGSGLSLSGGALTCLTASGSQDGCLSTADWSSFNGRIASSSLDTSSELAALLTDETGTAGYAVFSGNPLLTGFRSSASSTIGDGTGAGGLTISGGATTTGNAYFGGNVGVGIINPATKMHVDGDIRSNNFFVGSGLWSAPSLSFASGTNTGFFWDGNLGISVAGSLVARLNSSVFDFNGSYSPYLRIGGTNNTPASPTYAFDGSTNTGMYHNTSSGAADLGFSVNGFGAMIISSNTNVAIGTSTPWAKLSIQNNYGSTTPLFDIATTTSSAFATSSLFRVNHTGNIGIGTSTPYTKLTVAGGIGLTGALYDNTASAGTNGMVLQTTGTGVQWVATSSLGISGGDGMSNWLFDGTRLTPSTTAGVGVFASSTIGDGTGAGGLTIAGNSTTTLNAYIGGALGIGTPSPSATLALTGSGTTNLFAFASSTGSNLLSLNARGVLTFGTTTSADIFMNGGSTAGNPQLNQNNIAIGNQAFTYASTTSFATYNIALGNQALYGSSTVPMTGDYNFAGGYSSLYSNTTGLSNNALGYNALYFNTSGSYNNALGLQSLYSNTTGLYNNALGSFALYSNTTGTYNNALGNGALYSNTTGWNNNALGQNAGRYLTDGSSAASTTDYSLFLGPNTKALTADDQNSIVIGYNANGLGSNTVVLGNDSIVTTALKGSVGIGTSTPYTKLTVAGGIGLTGALYDNTASAGTNGMVLQTTGSGVTWVATSSLGLGGGAGDGVSNWSYNGSRLSPTTTAGVLGIGIFASSTIGDGTGAGGLTISGGATTTGNAYFASNIGIGTTSPSATLALLGSGTTNLFAFASSTGSNLLSLNARGVLTFGTTTNADIFLNGGATSSMTQSNKNNIAIGNQAFSYYTNEFAQSNIAIGHQSLYGSSTLPTTGDQNISIGNFTLYSNTTGSNNNSIGESSLFYNTTGSNNNVLGNTSLYSNTTGSYNNAIGYTSLYSNTTGLHNNALGFQSLLSNTTGSYNNAIGRMSLNNNTTGTDNNAFGRSSLLYNTTGTDNNAFGQLTLYFNTTGSYNTAIGYMAGYNMNTGTSTTFLGAYTNARAGVDVSSSTALGAGALLARSNSMVLGGVGANSVDIVTGTSTPWAKLSIQNNYGSTTPLFDIATTTSSAFATSSLFRVNHTGNIGIGTSTPYTKLTVAGGIGLTGALYDNTASAGTNGMVLQTTGTGVQWVATSSLGISGGDGMSNWLFDGTRLTPSTTVGIGIFASSTIGDGTGAGGLTISGGATTTGNAYFGGAVAIGTTSTSALKFDIADATYTSGESAAMVLRMYSGGAGSGSAYGGIKVDNTLGGNQYRSRYGVYGYGVQYGVIGRTVGSINSSYDLVNGWFTIPASGLTGVHSGTSYGSAINGVSASITSSNMMDLIHANSTFTGTGLQMSFAQSSGSFTGNFLKFLNNNVAKFVVNNGGGMAIGTSTLWAKVSIQNDYGSTVPLLDIATTTSSGYATSSLFRVGHDGKVGINTNSPSSALHVVGDIKYQKSGSTQPTITLTDYNGSYPNLVLSGSDGTVNTYLSSKGPLNIMVGDTSPGSSASRKLITGLINGNVGIGSSTPSRLLTVQGGDLWLGGDFYATGTASMVALNVSASSTLGYASSTALTIAGRLYDGANSAGTNGMVLQTTGSGVQWVATSTLGLSGGGSSLFTDGGNTTYLTATSDYLGLGTTSAKSKLAVYGDALLEGTSRYLNFGTATGSSGYGFRDNAGTMEFKNSGGTWQSVNTATTGPSFSVHKNGTDQTNIGTSPTLITWAGETFDTNNNFDLSTERFTPTVAGKYLLTATLYYSSLDVGDYAYAFMRKNGTDVAMNIQYSNTAGPEAVYVQVTAVVDANGSTDYFEIWGDTNTTVNETVSGGNYATYFSGALIAPVSQMAGGWTNDNTQSYLADSTDLVGIGTSTPQSKLTVQGTGTLNPFTVASSSGSTYLTVLSTGMVGIGTTTPSAALALTGSGTTNLFAFASSTGSNLLTLGADGRLTFGTTTNTNIFINGGPTSTNPSESTNQRNIGIGTQSLSFLGTSLTNNVAVGYQALYGSSSVLMTGDANVAFGNNAGRGNTTGYNNSFLGNTTGYYNSTGYENTFTGSGAGYNNTTGFRNSFVGAYAGMTNTTGSQNTFFGYNAGYNNTVGSYNSFLSPYAGNNNTTGEYNAFLGYNAGYGNTTGSQNVTVGPNANKYNQTGWANTALGAYAGEGTGGNSFASSTFVGYKTGLSLTTGSGNILLGYQAGDALTSGSNNIALGYDIDLPSNTASNQLTIGNLIFGTGIDGTGTTISSGNIGIGTTTPYAKLTVEQKMNGVGNLFQIASSSDGIATTTHFVVNQYGNVGMGTAIPGAPLEIYKDAGSANVTGGGLILSRVGDGNNIYRGGAIYSRSSDNGNSDLLVFGVTTNNFKNPYSDYSEARMVIDAAGYVGVGKTNPSEALDVTGNLALSGNASVGGTIDVTGNAYFSGTVSIGSSTPESQTLTIDKSGLTGAVIGGIKERLQFTNNTLSAVYYGDNTYIVNAPTATSTLVGSMLRIEDNSTLGNTVRGLEVQAYRGTNTKGENTALSGFARTFGVRGTTLGDAGDTYQPAGVFAETQGTTQGNALRAYSGTITSEELVSLFHDTSNFTGTGLQMNFGNAGGSFAATSSAKFIDLQVGGTSKFVVSANGSTTIGDGTVNASLMIPYGGICVDNDGSCISTTTGQIRSVTSALGNSDLAEMYFSGESLQTGEIVALAGGLSVERASEASAQSIIGVVSTKPGMTLGFDDSSLAPNEHPYPIGLKGRVPVRLSTENGPIAKGDRITISSITGVGMKATESSVVVGIALEDFDGTKAYSSGFLNQFGDDMVKERVAKKITIDPRTQDGCSFGGGSALGEESCDKERVKKTTKTLVTDDSEYQTMLSTLSSEPAEQITAGDGSETNVGQIIMFIDLGWYQIAEETNILAELASTTLLEDGSEEETLWSRVKVLASNFVDGVLTLAGLKTNELCVGNVCVDEATFLQMVESANATPIQSGVTGGGNDGSTVDGTGTTTDSGTTVDAGGVTGTTTDNGTPSEPTVPPDGAGDSGGTGGGEAQPPVEETPPTEAPPAETPPEEQPPVEEPAPETPIE